MTRPRKDPSAWMHTPEGHAKYLAARNEAHAGGGRGGALMPSTSRVECDTCGNYFDAVSDGCGTDTICPECFEAERSRLSKLYWDEQYKYIYNSKSAPRRKKGELL